MLGFFALFRENGEGPKRWKMRCVVHVLPLNVTNTVSGWWNIPYISIRKSFDQILVLWEDKSLQDRSVDKLTGIDYNSVCVLHHDNYSHYLFLIAFADIIPAVKAGSPLLVDISVGDLHNKRTTTPCSFGVHWNRAPSFSHGCERESSLRRGFKSGKNLYINSCTPVVDLSKLGWPSWELNYSTKPYLLYLFHITSSKSWIKRLMILTELNFKSVLMSINYNYH